jgi:DnaJ family protein C protein 13
LGFTPTAKLAAQHEAEPRVKERVKYQFQVTKLRNWRTGYQRLLVLYEQDFVTLDPDSLAVTNRWSYNNISSWQALKEDETIMIQVDPDQTKLKFTCHAVPRAVVLTALLESQDEAGLAPTRSIALLDAQRWTRHGTKYAVQFFVKSYGIQEVYEGRPVQIYRYKDIRGVSLAVGNDAAVILHFRQPFKIRLYEIYSPRGGRSELIGLMQAHCHTLGISLCMEPSQSVQEWIEQRRRVDIGPVSTSWPVTKVTLRPNTSQGIVSRQLVLTSQSWLVERASGGVVSCRRLKDLIGLVRHRESDRLTLEFANGSCRTYASPHRDGLIVSILDTAATVGHLIVLSDTYSLPQSLSWQWERDMEASSAAQSTQPSLFAPIAIPVYCLKRICAVSSRAYAYVAGTLSQLTGGNIPSMVVVKEISGVVEACREFNASVPPSGDGLPTGSNDKTINAAIGALWGLIHALLTIQGTATSSDQIGNRVHERRAAEEASAVLFSSLFRLSQAPTGYRKTVELTTFQETLPHIVGIHDVFSKFWAFQVLKALVVGLPGEQRDRETEYVNKNVIVKAGGTRMVKGLVESLTSYGKDGGSDLMQMVTSDILQSLVCSHYDTTAPEHFAAVTQALSESHRSLLTTLRSPTPFVLENTSLLLQVLSANAPEAAAKVRDAALSSAIILKYFHGAIFSPVEGYRFLCRYLCSLWFTGPMDCPEKRLLRRVVPLGFLPFLNMPGLSKMEQDQLDAIERDAIEGNIPESQSSATAETGASGTNTFRLRARIAIAYSQPSTNKKKPENYRIFFHVLTQDHSLPDLIWSQETRRELRIALETEIQYMQREIEARGDFSVAWNYQQFSVSYPSLTNEVKVGNIYMRLWLEAGDGFIRSWEDPASLFELLFRRFLCVVDRDHKVTIKCIRCMQRLYAIHWKAIGPISDLMILVHSMASTKSVETQHRLLELVAVLLGVSLTRQSNGTADVPDNAEQLLNSESIGQLCQFAAWGHNTGERVESLLSRTVVSQSGGNMITGASSESTSATPPQTNNAFPPVWFVAYSSKIPPPPEEVRGPFTISDLQRLFSDKELSPFDVVTASHVDDYEEDLIEGVEERRIDTGKWKRLHDLWQLRWILCMDGANGDAVLGPSEVALLSLKSLVRLVELHKSVDSSGTPYIPIPTAKRILSGKDKEISAAVDAGANPLSILSQTLLCNDGRIVGIGASLLFKLLQYNQDTMPKFYLTGVFFFALSYLGNNFLAIAHLLHCSHLKQHFQSGFKATAGEDVLRMKDRSILGSMLPEGLLYVLENYGFERFASVFAGDADTPEVIWTQEMRAHLVEMIRQHLGDFPLRILQNNTAEYEFCPIPPLSYRKLQDELFCHNFYLHNLCDEERFPDWPIAEPVKVFKACLEKFEEAVEKEAGSEDITDQAVKLLNLKDGEGNKELRRSYRKLARKYHPDKNPAGREMFESVQKAYEFLLEALGSGTKIRVNVAGGDHCAEPVLGRDTSKEKMRLLVKAQLLICRRYEPEMKRLKYPSYKVLLGCLQVDPELLSANPLDEPEVFLQHVFVRRDQAEFTQAAIELVFRTCLISPQNAEEVVAQSGLVVLSSLLQGSLKTISALTCTQPPEGSAPMHLFLDIILHAVRTLSGILFFDIGRTSLRDTDSVSISIMPVLYDCIDGASFDDNLAVSAAIRGSALEAVYSLAKDPESQLSILELGLLWPLIRCVLHFDNSAEGGPTAEKDINNISISANAHAKLAVQTLGEICVCPKDAAMDETLKFSFDALFTPPISALLRAKRYNEFLRLVTSNIEEAYVIWNSLMRSQLESLVKEQSVQRTGAQFRRRLLKDELQCLDKHKYEALSNEVTVGGVYVRVFNKLGADALRGIDDANVFGRALVECIVETLKKAGHFNFSNREQSKTFQELDRPEMFDLSVCALRVLLGSGGVSDDFIISTVEFPALVFSLLDLQPGSQAHSNGCDIAELSTKKGFAESVARHGGLPMLMQILEVPEENDDLKNSSDSVSKRKRTGWSILEAMSASPPFAALMVESTCWLELLGILCGYRDFTTSWFSRLGAAKALARILWDNSTSSPFFSLLARFLPPTLVVLLKDGAEGMLKQFDSDADTPELIWDGEMRSELRNFLSEQLDLVYQKAGNALPFVLDRAVRVRYEKLESELYVGGVYVTRFLKDPTYKMRDPTTFLDAVLKQREKEFEKFWPEDGGMMASRTSAEIVEHGSEDILHDLTTSAVYMCKVSESLCDKLAPWGYMSRGLESIEKALARHMTGTPLLETTRLLHVATNSLPNVEALASTSTSDGTHGIVDYMIKALGGGPLHSDSAFLVEFLFLLFKSALGDVGKKHDPASHANYSTTMAPSPAPGEGPVRHNREKISLGDDPLAMFGFPGMDQPPVQSVPPPRQGELSQTGPTTAQYTPQQQQRHVPQSPALASHQPLGYALPHRGAQNQGAFDGAQGRRILPQPSVGTGPQQFHPSQQSPFPYQQHGSQAQHPQPTPLQQHFQPAPQQQHFQPAPQQQHFQPAPQQQHFQPVSQQQPYGVSRPQLSQPGGYLNSPIPQSRQTPISYQQPQSLHHHHHQFVSQPPASQGTVPSGGSPFLQTRRMESTSSISDVSGQQWSSSPVTPPPPDSLRTQLPSTPDGQRIGSQSLQVQTPLGSQSLGVSAGISDLSSPPPTYQSSEAVPYAPHPSGAKAPPPAAPPPPPPPGPNLADDTNQPLVGRLPDLPDTQPPTQGTGVDARSTTDPSLTADQRALSTDGAPGASSSRVALLHQALACELCQFLVNDFLENMSLPEIKDPAAGKVNAINLLKLLTMDPGYGMKFKLILKDLPAWSKYKSQDHSLLLATSKRTDYFLTAGEQATPALLLTGGNEETDET